MEEKNWTTIISPKKSLLDFELKEIFKYKDLLLLFVKRDFVTIYKQTILGPLWFFIQPILTSLVFTVIFGNIAGIPTDGVPKILFYLAGITCWNYFSECLTKTSDTFITNQTIFGKVYFPRLIIPLSIVFSSLIKFLVQFLLFLIFYIYFISSGTHISPNIYIFLLPFLIILMAFLSLGLGIIISSLTTKYRDLRFLTKFGVQLWMYVTPVIYPLSQLKGKMLFLATLNPMTSIIETFKFAFLGKGTFSWNYLLYSSVFTLVVIVIGVLFFNKTEKNFMDTV
ncbi:MAG: ABC transporter permease [Bacteroidia bacterium]